MTAHKALPDAETVKYCMAIVRERDIDRYLATLFLPAEVRPDIYGLFAFDAEITHIRDMIKEPMMGEIRLQWWRDIISGDRAGEATNNPIASALMATIDAYDLPSMGFDNYLKAKVFDLYNDPMPDMGSFEGYAGETASFLFYQAATILGRSSAPKTDALADSAGHAGVVWTLLHTLKNLPNHRVRRQCFIPGEILDEAGMSRDAYYAAENEALSNALIKATLSKLRHHHQMFRKNSTYLEVDLKPAFLPMCLLPSYISRFEKRAGSALTIPVDIPQWRKQIYLWRAARNGKF